jgi:hypothetical protein
MLKPSVDRPAWTSDSCTGMFYSWKHKQRRPRDSDDCVQRNYYGNTCGFGSRTDAVRFMES